MTAQEARRISEANAYTIDSFKQQIKAMLNGGSNMGYRQIVTPLGIAVSDTFVSDVVDLGYNIKKHTNPIGLEAYVISW